MDISMDPIIIFYENMIKKTQSHLDLPEFSEIYLRLAFHVVFGENYTITSEALQLYRKLLVLHYCAKYPSIADVMSIMDIIFKKHEIYVIIADENELQEQWDAFKKSEISCSNLDEQKQKCIDLNLTTKSKNELKRKKPNEFC